MLGLPHVIAAAAIAAAAPAASLHLDVTGDGVRDVVEARSGFLTIHSASGVATAQLPGRLDGALAVRGIGALLLVRARAASYGVIDAPYRVHDGHVDRIHVEGLPADGLITALAGSAYVDIDCGASPRTVVQVEDVPTAHGWRETVLTLELRGQRLTLAGVTEHDVTHARPRSCSITRR